MLEILLFPLRLLKCQVNGAWLSFGLIGASAALHIHGDNEANRFSRFLRMGETFKNDFRPGIKNWVERPGDVS
jgi:hypothetical protein